MFNFRVQVMKTGSQEQISVTVKLKTYWMSKHASQIREMNIVESGSKVFIFKALISKFNL